jgi:nucleotide-binding universal stress UspA family protein
MTMSFSAILVHVDIERDCEQRIQLSLLLANQFGAALIGVAGVTFRPRFVAGGVALYSDPTPGDLQHAQLRLDEIGKKFCDQGRYLKQVEWRSALEFSSELLPREARAADLVIIGAPPATDSLHDLFEPGAIVLRAGRPILVAPHTFAPVQFRRVVVAWKETRESRRAVRDALPFLQQASEVLIFELGENALKSQAKSHLADVTAYLNRHGVIVAEQIWRESKDPVADELLRFIEEEKTDLVVAGGYGHSRLGEWIFGGVTHALLSESPVCCMLSH